MCISFNYIDFALRENTVSNFFSFALQMRHMSQRLRPFGVAVHAQEVHLPDSEERRSAILLSPGQLLVQNQLEVQLQKTHGLSRSSRRTRDGMSRIRLFTIN